MLSAKKNVDVSQIGSPDMHLSNFARGPTPSTLVDIELHGRSHPSA
jgi:hypothetical protein